MDNNERNTHFKGFAKREWHDMRTKFAELDIDVVDGCSLCSLPEAKIDAIMEILLAQCAYDLVYHIRRQTGYGMDLFDIERWIAEDVPDLTKLPPIPPQP